MCPATGTALDSAQLDLLAVNTIRFLSGDAVQKTDSGHPDLPLGAAPMAYVLWMRHLRHNPANPQWFNRDRFGASGPGPVVMREYGFTVDQVRQRAMALLAGRKA